MKQLTIFEVATMASAKRVPLRDQVELRMWIGMVRAREFDIFARMAFAQTQRRAIRDRTNRACLRCLTIDADQEVVASHSSPNELAQASGQTGRGRQ